MNTTLDMTQEASRTRPETALTGIGNYGYDGRWGASGTLEEVVEVDRIVANPINGRDPTGTKRLVFVFDGWLEDQTKIWDTFPFAPDDNKKQTLIPSRGTVTTFKIWLDNIPDTQTFYFTNGNVKDAVTKAESLCPNATGDSVIAVGWSMGGNAALHFAAELAKNQIKSVGFTTDVIPAYRDAAPGPWLNYYQRYGDGRIGIFQSGNSVLGATNYNITSNMLVNYPGQGTRFHFLINEYVEGDLYEFIKSVPATHLPNENLTFIDPTIPPPGRPEGSTVTG
jgi:hypothetical protein